MSSYIEDVMSDIELVVFDYYEGEVTYKYTKEKILNIIKNIEIEDEEVEPLPPKHSNGIR